MKAFHNDSAVKKKYVDRVIKHQKLDHLVRGTGWDGTRGCAVGCTLENYSHSKYETELGIPEWLARLEDSLFENMTEEKSRTWPEKFLKAIPIGADLEPVKARFICVILEHSIGSMSRTKFDHKKFPDVVKALDGSRAAVEQMIAAHKAGDQKALSAARSAAESAASAARSAAESAASAAESAARSAARSAAESAARLAAWSAAESAARSAASAAWSAASAARSAAWSAASAASAARSAAESAAESSAYDFYADELLKLLKKAKAA